MKEKIIQIEGSRILTSEGRIYERVFKDGDYEWWEMAIPPFNEETNE